MTGAAVCGRIMAILGVAMPVVAQERLDDLLNTPVEVAARGPRQRRNEAPSIVSVISREEIQERGYLSVAEALKGVPGFYDICDGVTEDLGVRGVQGGLRGWSRIVKVLIDGQPVAFRSDLTNALGPELIPMEAVERIEVIRGPASSLYGANAFLGVIQVVTRKGDGTSLSGQLTVRGLPVQNGAASGLWVARDFGRWVVRVAVGAADVDLSGRRLPASSPILLSRPNLARQRSEGEYQRPRSLLLSGDGPLGPDGRLECLGQFSRLDSGAAFLDFGTLRPGNRVVLENGFFRVKATQVLTESWSVMGSLAGAWGAPGSEEHLDNGADTSYLRRDMGYSALDGQVEATLQTRERDSFVFGASGSRSQERLMSVVAVDAVTGVESRLNPRADKTFTNAGPYLQAMVYPTEGLGLTGNLRVDRHSVYGTSTTWRLGVVLGPRSGWYGKLLCGTSFNAPGAFQLYGKPLFATDVRGNENLRPERARTYEAEVGWSHGEVGAFSLNVFSNRVHDKVELLPAGLNQLFGNVGLLSSRGAECQAELRVGPHRWSGSVSWQRTESVTSDVFRGDLREPSARFPRFSGSLAWSVRAGAGLVFGLQVSQASPRRATDSNLLERVYGAYALPSVTLVDAWWSQEWVLGPAMRGRLQAQGRNLLNRVYAEPGFQGVDLPGRRREFRVGLGLSF